MARRSYPHEAHVPGRNPGTLPRTKAPADANTNKGTTDTAATMA